MFLKREEKKKNREEIRVKRKAQKFHWDSYRFALLVHAHSQSSTKRKEKHARRDMILEIFRCYDPALVVIVL